MIDQDFCDFLEYYLSKALAVSSNEQMNRIWCDGILLPDSESAYSLKQVSDTRQVVFDAFSGESGQDKYKLTLNFGKKALSRYARGLEIYSCISADEISNWFSIDANQRVINVKLT